MTNSFVVLYFLCIVFLLMVGSIVEFLSRIQHLAFFFLPRKSFQFCSTDQTWIRKHPLRHGRTWLWLIKREYRNKMCRSGLNLHPGAHYHSINRKHWHHGRHNKGLRICSPASHGTWGKTHNCSYMQSSRVHTHTHTNACHKVGEFALIKYK